MPDAVRERVEVLDHTDSTSLGLWRPSRGTESERAVEAIESADGRDQVLAESAAVLSRCLPPGQRGARTGLVVGYVQSGKTLSFTTVTAMARDNNFRFFIVIAGTSLPLFDQSGARLVQDLGPFAHWSAWAHVDSNRLAETPSIRNQIKTWLEEWDDEAVPAEDRRAVLLTVMKNGHHLDRVTNLLRRLGPVLERTPTLIIDDEADQASLNTRVNAREESATYRRLGEVRAVLPQHTLLQYTATPQAPLLINIIDALSPDFAEVLTPGEAYTGGQAFFESDLRLVRTIPDAEIISPDSQPSAPPSSLLEAMRVFFLGVAAGKLTARGDPHPSPVNRSMMIHPHRLTAMHHTFHRWVEAVKDRWEATLAGRQATRDRDAELALFREAYVDLSRTAEDLPPFEDLVTQLPRSIRNTMVLEMNASRGDTPVPAWKDHYAHILVGGQALDRGFTVEGLTVTYMPRGLGVGNADTLQQRARWFGYKAGYLGYCRVYLSSTGEHAYRKYLEHEESVRESLRRHSQSGKSLSEWKRAFILDSAFRPTRRTVLQLDHQRYRFGGKWEWTKAPHDVKTAVEGNRDVFASFIDDLEWKESDGHPDRRPQHRHLFAEEVPLRRALEHLFLPLRIPSATDSPLFTALQIHLEEYAAEHPDATCTIYRMSPKELRSRGTNAKNGEISELFAGGYPYQGKDKESIYPGDRKIRANQGISIQLHRLDVYDGKVTDGKLLQKDVPVVAVWVPREMGQQWLVQNPTQDADD